MTTNDDIEGGIIRDQNTVFSLISIPYAVAESEQGIANLLVISMSYKIF
jgi:hypothetical protein